MRFIEKGPAPAALTKWYENEVPQNRCYDGIPTEVKKAIREALWREQYGICAYTMKRLDSSEHLHIEHFHPQSPQPDVPQIEEADIDFGNMLGCYPAGNLKGQEANCGYGSSQRGNKPLPISPLQQRCETSFHYDISGNIEGVSEDARQVIKILKLCDTKLTAERASTFQGFGLSVQPDDPYGDFPLLTAFQALELANRIMRPVEGRLAEFCVAIEQVARDYARALTANS